MLGIVSMAGNALKAFGNTHPAIKLGVIVLAFLLAAEFVGNEGLSLYQRIATVKATTDVTNAESRAKQAAQCTAMGRNADCSIPDKPIGNLLADDPIFEAAEKRRVELRKERERQREQKGEPQ